jgi:hypothetical protein
MGSESSRCEGSAGRLLPCCGGCICMGRRMDAGGHSCPPLGSHSKRKPPWSGPLACILCHPHLCSPARPIPLSRLATLAALGPPPRAATPGLSRARPAWRCQQGGPLRGPPCCTALTAMRPWTLRYRWAVQARAWGCGFGFVWVFGLVWVCCAASLYVACPLSSIQPAPLPSLHTRLLPSPLLLIPASSPPLPPPPQPQDLYAQPEPGAEEGGGGAGYKAPLTRVVATPCYR